jgi:Hsp70 protein
MTPTRFLAIDFGTTQTAAALWVAGNGGATLVQFDGDRTAIPSAVFRDGDTSLTGVAAERSLLLDPVRGLRTPKRLLRHGSSFAELGGAEPVALMELIGDVMGEVHERARAQLGAEPDRLCLTCPIAWRDGGPKRRALQGAAALAGIRAPVEVVSEPEAAARHLGADLAAGKSCVVYDLGGGTCDIAVMEMGPGGLELRAEAEQELGGETFDEELFVAVLERLADDDADASEQLWRLHEDPAWADGDLVALAAWRRCLAAVAANVRAAKERLSHRDSAAILLPGPVDREYVFTRAEFERLIATHVEETVEELEDCIRRSGLTPDAVFLAGAASQVPAVRRAVQAATGREPVLADDPKGAIALGGIRRLTAPMEQAERDRIAAERRRKAEASSRKQVAERAQQERQEANRELVRRHPVWGALAEPAKSQLVEDLRGDEEFRYLVLCVCSEDGWGTRSNVVMITTKRCLRYKNRIRGLLRDVTPLADLTNPRAGLFGRLIWNLRNTSTKVTLSQLGDQSPKTIAAFIKQHQ